MSERGRADFKKRVSSAFEKVKEWLSDALFPKNLTCDCCGAELVDDTRYRLCSECMSGMIFCNEHRCLVCGVPIADEADYCIRCQKAPCAFVKNRSPFVYDGLARELIIKLKGGGQRYIAETLGAFMADEYLGSDYDCDIAVFVPMSAEEIKRRRFNQSELLAYEVGERLNMPVLPALVKIKDTSAQKALNKDDREKNLNGAFECPIAAVKGRKILLIDDVFTTGATANECSKVLLKAGARSVFVLTAAVTERKIVAEGADGSAVRL